MHDIVDSLPTSFRTASVWCHVPLPHRRSNRLVDRDLSHVASRVARRERLKRYNAAVHATVATVARRASEEFPHMGVRLVADRARGPRADRRALQSIARRRTRTASRLGQHEGESACDATTSDANSTAASNGSAGQNTRRFHGGRSGPTSCTPRRDRTQARSKGDTRANRAPGLATAGASMRQRPATCRSDGSTHTHRDAEARLRAAARRRDDDQPRCAGYARNGARTGCDGHRAGQGLVECGRLVLAATVFRSSGSPLLDRAALQAARQSSYAPEIDDCVKVAGDYIFRADFEGN